MRYWRGICEVLRLLPVLSLYARVENYLHQWLIECLPTHLLCLNPMCSVELLDAAELN